MSCNGYLCPTVLMVTVLATYVCPTYSMSYLCHTYVLQYLCPSLATILLNTYHNDVCLFIDGRQLLSTEGTTQGDPLAMAMYAISVLPLINVLRECDVNQTWFADDGGSRNDLRGWWSRLVTLGPAYGYFVNAVKTWLIVKEKSF